jgi:hypothetical protein
MTGILIAVARFLWAAAVVQWSVNWLRERSAERADLSFRDACWTTLGLLVAERICGTLGLLPGLGLGSWFVFVAIWLGTFALYHRLGFLRTLAIVPLQGLGMLVFALVLRLTGLGA